MNILAKHRDSVVIAVLVVMLVGFVVRYPIPPLVDYLGHIGLSLASINGGGEFYRLTDPISYKLLHIIVIALSVISTDFAWVAGTAYLIVLALLVGVTLLVAGSMSQLSKVTVGLILILTLPVAHSLLFVWGVVPFFLAFWSFLAGAYLAIPLDRRLAQGLWDHRTMLMAGLQMVVLVSMVLSHPFGIGLLALTGIWMLLLQLVHRRHRLIRLALLAIVFIGFYLMVSHDFMSIGSEGFVKNFEINDLFRSTIAWRLQSLRMGSFYDLRPLTGPVMPWWYDLIVNRVLTLLPFVCLFFLVVLVLKPVSLQSEWARRPAYIFGIMGFAGFCLVLVFGPDFVFKVSLLPGRLYGAMIPLISAVLAVMMVRLLGSTRMMLVFPLILAIEIYLFAPLYSIGQDLMTTARKLQGELESSVVGLSSSRRMLFVNYEPTGFQLLGSMLHYRIIPFIMIGQGDLFKKGIILIHEWNDGDSHLPVRFDLSQFNGVMRGGNRILASQAMWTITSLSRTDVAIINGPIIIRFVLRFPTKSASFSEPLITYGVTGAGDFFYVKYFSDSKVAFCFNHWGRPEVMSDSMVVQPGRPYELNLILNTWTREMQVFFSGRTILSDNCSINDPTDLTIGENKIGGTGPGPRFSGQVDTVSVECNFKSTTCSELAAYHHFRRITGRDQGFSWGDK